MIFDYCQKALEKAEYKMLEDETWFAEIPGFSGVWANGENVEECRSELLEVLEEWIILKWRDGDPVPEVDGRTIEIKERAVAEIAMPIPRRDLVKKFRELGFLGPYSGGKHQFMIRGQLKIRIPNPHKAGEISDSLLREILRQAGIEKDDWDNV